MNDFDVTIQARVRHKALDDAVKLFGGQRQLAEHIGVSLHTLSHWILLKRFPSEKITEETRSRLECVTGLSFEELFPEWVQHAEFFNMGVVEKSTSVAHVALEGSVADEIAGMLPSPETVAKQHELRDAMKGVLKTLTYREREILKLRFGLGGDGRAFTLAECASVFKVSKDRVRQIEVKAIRKLQDPVRERVLKNFLDQNEAETTVEAEVTFCMHCGKRRSLEDHNHASDCPSMKCIVCGTIRRLHESSHKFEAPDGLWETMAPSKKRERDQDKLKARKQNDNPTAH